MVSLLLWISWPNGPQARSRSLLTARLPFDGAECRILSPSTLPFGRRPRRGGISCKSPGLKGISALTGPTWHGHGQRTLRPTGSAAREAWKPFSADAAARTDSIDAAARAKCRWLGGRCAYILAHDPIPKVKDLKFEPVPVANKSVKKTRA